MIVSGLISTIALLAFAGTYTKFQTYVKIEVDGQDVTDNLDPYLISVTVTDFEYQLDQCIIELDDSYGVLPIPPDNAPLKISMGHRGAQMEMVFTGRVADVSSRCQRRSGRILIIEGKGADVYGQGKAPTSQEWGEGQPAKGEAKKIRLDKVLSDAAKAAGYEFKADPEIGKIERDYWLQIDESFQSFLDRIAREVGGVPKIAGKNASITSNVKNTNVNGSGMSDIPCTWGETLIAWDIHPKSGRPMFSETAKSWFNDAKGVWETVKKAVNNTGASGLTKAIHFGLMPVATKDEAEAAAQADANASVRNVGYGWVVIDGNPSAAAGANAVVKGARSQVDGTYRITEAEHTYRRRSGYTVRLELKMPGAAGGSSGPSQEFGG